jgi:hypothetical protein
MVCAARPISAESAMNRNLLIGITAFGVVSAATTVSALAAAPHGHARTTTALRASLNYCSHQTGGAEKDRACVSAMPLGNGASWVSPTSLRSPTRCVAASGPDRRLAVPRRHADLVVPIQNQMREMRPRRQMG